MTTKIDRVLDITSDIRVKIGKVEQHLQSLNGIVSRHEVDISSLKKTVYKIVGGCAAIVVLLQLISYYL